jgi:hypothetical protein
MICKDNAEINCITVQDKKDSFPLTLTSYLCIMCYVIAKMLKINRRHTQTQFTQIYLTILF